MRPSCGRVLSHWRQNECTPALLLRIKEELSLHHRNKDHQGPSLGGPGAERLRLLDLNQAGMVSRLGIWNLCKTNALIAWEILDPTLKWNLQAELKQARAYVHLYRWRSAQHTDINAEIISKYKGTAHGQDYANCNTFNVDSCKGNDWQEHENMYEPETKAPQQFPQPR